ncbi:MAG TPA: hypothetical protein PLC59_03965 [Bacteroidales bacterium]|nr:hypothetical protein [Bacteroidales bacterium]HQI45190.1 hypothetical protein [Bacteroidales bacterium]
MKKLKRVKYGLFYWTSGRWTSKPYEGVTFTEKQLEDKILQYCIKNIKNNVLKTYIRILPVKLQVKTNKKK